MSQDPGTLNSKIVRTDTGYRAAKLECHEFKADILVKDHRNILELAVPRVHLESPFQTT